MKNNLESTVRTLINAIENRREEESAEQFMACGETGTCAEGKCNSTWLLLSIGVLNII